MNILLAVWFVIGGLLLQSSDVDCPISASPVLEEIAPAQILPLGADLLIRYVDGPDILETVIPMPDGTDLLPSDDGRLIAYVHSVDAFNYDLWVVGVTGEPRLLIAASDMAALRPETDVAGYGPLQIAWVPGTRELAFGTRVYYDSEGIFEPIADDLHIVNADTGEVRTLLNAGEGGQFTFSPDGQYAVIESYTTLQLVTLAGDVQPIPLASYQAVGLGHTIFYPQVGWRPDSSSFVIAVPANENPAMAQSDGITEIWEVSVNGGDPVLLGTHTAFFLSFEMSPDLTRVAYWVTDAPMSNTRTLAVADVTGENRVELATADLLDLESWLPDSLHIVYTLSHEDGSRTRLIGSVCG